ncbi:uncharacterized protein LOC105697903 [Orussus abietinus]|uniref:uncharacterized protein LOC105697903 n=1 Tax=Orussus abietinus TaxID=222816 RepID=UPI0006259231|nr:uncharacterized protein LOC105697903 [Orussus abietinus]
MGAFAAVTVIFLLLHGQTLAQINFEGNISTETDYQAEESRRTGKNLPGPSNTFHQYQAFSTDSLDGNSGLTADHERPQKLYPVYARNPSTAVDSNDQQNLYPAIAASTSTFGNSRKYGEQNVFWPTLVQEAEKSQPMHKNVQPLVLDQTQMTGNHQGLRLLRTGQASYSDQRQSLVHDPINDYRVGPIQESEQNQHNFVQHPDQNQIPYYAENKPGVHAQTYKRHNFLQEADRSQIHYYGGNQPFVYNVGQVQQDRPVETEVALSSFLNSKTPVESQAALERYLKSRQQVNPEENHLGAAPSSEFLKVEPASAGMSLHQRANVRSVPGPLMGPPYPMAPMRPNFPPIGPEAFRFGMKRPMRRLRGSVPGDRARIGPPPGPYRGLGRIHQNYVGKAPAYDDASAWFPESDHRPPTKDVYYSQLYAQSYDPHYYNYIAKTGKIKPHLYGKFNKNDDIWTELFRGFKKHGLKNIMTPSFLLGMTIPALTLMFSLLVQKRSLGRSGDFDNAEYIQEHMERLQRALIKYNNVEGNEEVNEEERKHKNQERDEADVEHEERRYQENPDEKSTPKDGALIRSV